MADSLSEAEARSVAARQRLTQTVNGIQDRLNPRNLAKDAADTILEGGGKAARAGAEAIRENPGKAAGAVALALAVALLARHRIAAVVRKGKRNHPG